MTIYDEFDDNAMVTDRIITTRSFRQLTMSHYYSDIGTIEVDTYIKGSAGTGWVRGPTSVTSCIRLTYTRGGRVVPPL